MRFSKGEMAIVLANSYAVEKYGAQCECEVYEVGPYTAGYIHPCLDIQTLGSDYIIRTPDGQYWFCNENQLRKRPPSQEQQDARNRHLAGCREILTFPELMTELSPVSEETAKKVFIDNMWKVK
jgi:hypothetical protein